MRMRSSIFTLFFQFFTPTLASGRQDKTAAAEFKETVDSYFKYDKRQPLSPLAYFPTLLVSACFKSMVMFKQSRGE